MTLKNIFGKTIEAAKESARQMYGDDILVLEATEGDGNGQKARITIVSDNQEAAPKPMDQPRAITPRQASNGNGVHFERSAPGHTNGQNGTSSKLQSLRKYAQQQISSEELVFKNGHANGTNGSAHTNGHAEKLNGKEEKPAGNMYRRATVRPAEKNISQNGSADTAIAEEPKAEKSFITHFKPTEPAEKKRADLPKQTSSRADQREINALHKRFDKLEALLDSSLISSNLDYASHPVFQQLVQTGINTSVIAGWFSSIIKEGIDPYEQLDVFMTKIAGIIRDSLGKAPTEDPQKYMLFAGPSGSGKTSMIMKLSQQIDFLGDKKVAVVSVLPQEDKSTPYYTILEPFCADNDIPYYKINNGVEVTKLIEEWEEFDHVLIDTPSLGTEQDNSFREYWKIRQILTPLAPLEVHYVVNASLNRFYFRDSSATHHPLQPDYVAITHLDEVSQWGPVIPFLKTMGCTARYISKGTKLMNSLKEFSPQWFAQKVLQEN